MTESLRTLQSCGKIALCRSRIILRYIIHLPSTSNFSKLMRIIHISMTSTFQCEYCRCFTFKRCDKLKLKCTSHGGIVRIILEKLTWRQNSECCNADYKITKIVRALWLAERSVCMSVYKHGCGVRLFGFSPPNHASTKLKKFSSSKLDKFILYLYPFLRRLKLGKSLHRRCVNFSSLKLTF